MSVGRREIMMSKEEVLRFKNMSLEEQRADLLDSASDAIRGIAKQIAMIKAISYRKNNIAPEDFDAVLNRELSKAWEKVKDKQSHELAAMAFLEMISNGADPEEILRGK